LITHLYNHLTELLFHIYTELDLAPTHLADWPNVANCANYLSPHCWFLCISEWQNCWQC